MNEQEAPRADTAYVWRKTKPFVLCLRSQWLAQNGCLKGSSASAALSEHFLRNEPICEFPRPAEHSSDLTDLLQTKPKIIAECRFFTLLPESSTSE
jgi:hypothetical protein